MAIGNNNFIDEIKSVANIVDEVGQVVPLKRAGSNYKGCCPFHNEKTPSFVVSETKQIFTCFGCGATGDVIEFTKRYYNLDFMEAAQKLGDKYNKKIWTKDSHKKEANNLFYEINREAAAFFMKAMFVPGNSGYKYITGRGITPDTIKAFGLGYADGEWHSLMDHLLSKGYDKKSLITLGLIAESKGRYYDKFRNRVMFPIINTSGKVIGFGGRIIGDGEPKYMNSPESPIFLKKNNLYALNLTRQSIGKEDTAIVVEGNMDVVSLYQAGVYNVCATCGTALTENQARLIKRYTPNVVLSYDSDSAGRKAALRGIEILHAAECKVKVLHVTDGKDPDDFVKKHGASAFKELVKEASTYAEYKIEDVGLKHNITKEYDKLEYMKDVAKVLSSLGPIEQDIYIKKISSGMDISEGALRREVTGEAEKLKDENAKAVRPYSEGHSEKEDLSSKPITKLERQLLHIMLMEPVYYKKIAARQNAFESDSGRAIYEAVKLQMKEDPDRTDFDEKRIADYIDEKYVSTLKNIMENEPMGGNVEAVMQQCFNTIERNDLEKRYQELIDQLEIAGDSETDVSVQREIMEECKFIRERIEELK